MQERNRKKRGNQLMNKRIIAGNLLEELEQGFFGKKQKKAGKTHLTKARKDRKDSKKTPKN